MQMPLRIYALVYTLAKSNDSGSRGLGFDLYLYSSGWDITDLHWVLRVVCVGWRISGLTGVFADLEGLTS
jgi:hypothetical protein